MDIQNFINNFAEQLDSTPVEELTVNTFFRDLQDWSSLTALLIISMIDEEYDVVLRGEDMRAANTIGELFEIIKTKKDNNGSF